MRLVERMLLQLNSTYNGDAWHGTPLRLMLDDIDESRANARPIANAHTIAELVGHVITWMDVVQKRLLGEQVEVTAAMDFPSGIPWNDLLVRLDRAHSRLLDTVARMRDEEFDRVVPDADYTVDFMLHGMLHHNTYHAAQIALLKK